MGSTTYPPGVPLLERPAVRAREVVVEHRGLPAGAARLKQRRVILITVGPGAFAQLATAHEQHPRECCPGPQRACGSLAIAAPPTRTGLARVGRPCCIRGGGVDDGSGRLGVDRRLRPILGGGAGGLGDLGSMLGFGPLAAFVES